METFFKVIVPASGQLKERTPYTVLEIVKGGDKVMRRYKGYIDHERFMWTLYPDSIGAKKISISCALVERSDRGQRMTLKEWREQKERETKKTE